MISRPENIDNIYDVIKHAFSKREDSVAVKHSGKGSITYSNLFKKVDDLTITLKAAGFKPYDRIALFMEDSMEYIILALAVLNTDGVIVPASPSLSSNELDSLCERIKVKYLICEKEFSKFRDVLKTDPEKSDLLKSNLLKSDLEKSKTAKAGILKSDIFEKIHLYEINKTHVYSKKYMEVESPAFIRFSSGTTGESKGVLLTHQAIYDRTSAADARLAISQKDTVAWFLSMSYHFVVSILLFLRRGALIVLCHDNFPNGMLNSFKTDKPTFMYASPFHYNMLAKSDNIPAELLSDVRMAVVTAVSLTRKTNEIFYEKFKIHLSQAYGIIEVGLPFINDRFDDDFVCSVGRISPGYDLRISNKDAKGEGSIQLFGKGMFHAYISPWKKREQWFDTGDIGHLVDNYLFISGRKKNVINFAGMKIFPKEVEEVILNFDTVLEVRVSGEDHDTYGQLPVAEIVPRKGVELDLLTLKRHCHKNLDSYKVPKQFIEVKNIEKTHSNKIKRV